HNDRPIPIRALVKPVQSPLASIEIRHFVYTRLIETSPATRYQSLLITGEKGLFTRGLKENHFSNYGGLPAEWQQFSIRKSFNLKTVVESHASVQSFHRLKNDGIEEIASRGPELGLGTQSIPQEAEEPTASLLDLVYGKG